MRKVLSIIILAFTMASYAQMVSVKERPSFYLGKRGVVDLAITLQPTISPMREKQFDKSASFGLNLDLPIYLSYNPELVYTYALNNKMALYAKTEVYRSVRTSGSVRVPDPNYPDYTYLRSYTEQGIAVLKGKTIGLGLSWYQRRKSSIAPIGNHFSVGASKSFVKASHTDMGLYNMKYNNDLKTVVPILVKSLADEVVRFKYYSVDFEYSYSELLGKSLYYSFGIGSSFNIGLLEFVDAPDDADVERQLISNAKESLRFRDLVVMKLGLGYVIH